MVERVGSRVVRRGRKGKVSAIEKKGNKVFLLGKGLAKFGSKMREKGAIA